MSRWLVRLLLAFVMLLGVVSPVGAQERVDASEETLEDKPAEPGEVPADERAAVPPVFESGSDVPAPFGVGVPGVDGLVLEGPQAPIDVTGRSAAPVASADPVELRNGDVAPGEAPVFKPIEERSGSVGLEVARSTVPGVPVELVVPEVDRGRGREVRLSTPAPAVTSSLSPLGVAFQVELAGLGGVPAQARGLDLPTRRGPGGEEITDLGGSTGWFVEVDLDALPSEALTLVQDRLEIVFHTGCDAKGVCRTVESLPSDVDAENGVVRAELPRNVLNLVGGSEAKGVAVPGVGRGAGGSAIGVMPLSSLVAMFQGSQNSYFSVNTTTSGAQGNYSATSLASLSSWQVGTSTGHFETSFQVAMPPSVGPVPAVGLSYSSGTVDGMNTVSNNQSGLVGLGWNLSMPVITRATRPCTNNDAGGSYNDNLCFAVGEHDGFSLSMDGVGGRLVRTSASADEHPNYPPGSGITFHTYVLESMNDMRIWKVQAPDLPDDQGNPGVLNSWWEITTGDGTLHVFGRDLVMKPTTATTEPPLREDRGVHAEPAASLERLDSNLTAWMYIPGYAHATECVTGTNLCEVVTAWHLDQSIDTSGNMSIRRYWSQGNFYKAKHGSTDSHRSYVRAVHPMSWDYGMTFGDQLIPEASHSSAPQRVRFEYAFRNEIGGAGDTWYDTPTDLLCGSSGCTKTSPSYFTEYAIVQFRTFAGSMASRYALTYTWPQSSDSLDGRKLFLESIQQQSGSGLNMPPVSYDLVMLGNRVNHPSGVPEMQMPRIDTVTTEFGGVTSVNYGQSHAPTTSGACNKNGPTTLIRMPCDMFPSYDAHTGAGGWVLWNKWKTLSVTQDARVGGSANQTMTYSYIDAPSWAYSESWGHNGQAASQCATGYGCNHWNDYRGHQRVAVTDADGNRTEHFFITGMAEDRWNQNAQSGTVASNTGGTTAPEYALDPNGQWRYNTIAHRGRSLGTRQETDTGALKFHDLRLTVTATVSAQTSWPTVYRVTQENSYPVVSDPVAAQIDTRRRVITYYDHRTRISRVRDDGDWTSAQSWNTGDERSTCYYYSENEPDWIVSLPHTVATTDSEACSAWGNWTTATVYNYDGGAFQVAPTQGRVTQQLTQIRRSGSSPVWQTTDFSYNTRGQVLSETNANISGATTTYTYDATRHWLATTDGPLPGTDDKTTFIVDPRWGVQTQIQAPNSQTTNLTYDGLGRLLTVTLPGAPKASYEFTYTINQTGNPSRVATETLRNPGGANEYIQTFEFLDGFARTIQTRQAPANGTGAIVTSQFYDDIGQVRAVSAPFLMAAGPGVYESHGWGGLARTVYSYDTLGTTTTEVKNASGTQATSSVAVRGNQTTVTDANGQTTVTTVDTFGRTTLVVDANGGDTEYTYNTRDDLRTITDPQNNVISNVYDNWELQPTRLIDPDLGTLFYNYDSAGRLRQQIDGKGQQLWVTYDVLSRPTELRTANSTAANTRVSEWDYDPAGGVGLLESSTHYNRVGSASNGVVTKSYTYDSRLRPTNIEWDIAGFVDDISYAYRESGALDTVTYPDGTQSSYGYDALERPTTLTYDGDTVVRGVTYNTRGQVANLLRGLPDWTGGNEASLDTAYTYEDWSGRIVTAATTGHQPNAGVSGSIIRMYAAVLDRGTDAGETPIDAGGYGYWLTQYQHGYPLANIANAFYNSTEADGWLSSYVDTYTGATLDASPSGSEADFVNWAYDHILDRGPGGRSVSYWVGLLGGGWSRAQVIAFFSEHSSARANPDMESSTAPVAPTASTTDIPVDYTYTWDDVGNLTSLRETSYALDQTQCYGYDNLHRLTDGYTRSDTNCAGGYQAVGPDPYNVDYSYDPIGNITAATGTNTPGGAYEYNGAQPHAVTDAGPGYSFVYDNAGNMTSRVTPSGTQTLTYDTQNRLVGISGAGPDLDALYDAHGVRVKRTLGSDVTYYLTDGYETDGASSDTVHHTIGGTNVGATVNGVLHVGASDHLGSGNFTRSESGAAARNRYQPYGQRRGASANTLPTDITFTGQTDDRGTGLIDYNARHYDPIVGRFIMADPVLGGPDRYTYVQGRPTILTDPSGHLPGQGSGSQSDQVAYLNKVTKHCLQNGDGAGTSGTARQNGCFGSRTLRTRGYLGPDEANSGCLASGGRTGCRGDEARVHADLLCSANGLSCSDFGDGIQWEVGLKVFNRTILRTDFLVYDASDGEWVLFELKVADGLRETAQQAVAGKIQVEAYEDLLNAIGVPTRLGSADDFEEIFGGSRWAELFGVTGVQSHGRATVLATDGVILAISERTGRPPSVPLPVGLLEEVPDVAATFGAAIAGLGAIGLLYGGPHGQPR